MVPFFPFPVFKKSNLTILPLGKSQSLDNLFVQHQGTNTAAYWVCKFLRAVIPKLKDWSKA
jgi:hypothetical protein